MRDGLFIAGVWRKPAEDRFIEVFNPYTERVVSTGGREDVARAVSAARSALPGWKSAGGRARARFLRAVAQELEAGLVWINSPQTIFVETSWGGFKASGIGRELGPWGLSAYLRVKHVTRWVGGYGRP
jgi:betaine-aldehyde dehydrogenase